MELVEAPTLAERLVAGALSPDECTRVLSGVAEAIDAAAASGTLVRDLTPATVLIHPVRGGLLGDLGVAGIRTTACGPVPVSSDPTGRYESARRRPSPERSPRPSPAAGGARWT